MLRKCWTPPSAPISLETADDDPFVEARNGNASGSASADPVIPTEHAILLRSRSSLDLLFKVRSTNPAVLVCSPSSGVLRGHEAIMLVVKIFLRKRDTNGVLLPVDLCVENPKLKIVVHKPDRSNPSHSYEVLVIPAHIPDPIVPVEPAEDQRISPPRLSPPRIPPRKVAVESAHTSSVSQDRNGGRTARDSTVAVAIPSQRARQLQTPKKSDGINFRNEPPNPDAIVFVDEDSSNRNSQGLLPYTSQPADRMVEPARVSSGIMPLLPPESVTSSPEAHNPAAFAALACHNVPGWEQSCDVGIWNPEERRGWKSTSDDVTVLPPSVRRSPPRHALDSTASAANFVTAAEFIGNRTNEPTNPIAAIDETQRLSLKVSDERTPADGQLNRVRVIVRVRPPAISSNHATASSSGVEFLSNAHRSCWNYTATTLSDEDTTFRFDAVVGPHKNNYDVTQVCEVKRVMEDAAKGINACFLLYGQTNSGKTYTMFGDWTNSIGAATSTSISSSSSASRKSFGLIFYAVDVLFRALRKENGDVVALSCFEIYNEDVRDLLAESLHASDANRTSNKVSVSYDASSDIFCLDGLLEARVHDMPSLAPFLNGGLTQATIGTSHLNDRSSRAHTVIRLRIERYLDGGTSKVHSEVTFVDLAGSESINAVPASNDKGDVCGAALKSNSKIEWVDSFHASGVDEKRTARRASQRETTSINLSLTSLKKVVLALSQSEKRDQKHSRLNAAGPNATDGTGSTGPEGIDDVSSIAHSAGGSLPVSAKSSPSKSPLKRSRVVAPLAPVVSIKPGVPPPPSSSASYIPFRDSTLTKILKSTLSGKSRVVLICTVSIEAANRRETKSTLQFGTLAKSIPTRNIVVGNATSRASGLKLSESAAAEIVARSRQLEDENASLKKRLAKLEATILAQTPSLPTHLLPGSSANCEGSRQPSLLVGLSLPREAAVVHYIDRGLHEFEESESKLRQLVSSTLKFVHDGVRVLVLERTPLAVGVSVAASAKFERLTSTSSVGPNTTSRRDVFQRMVSTLGTNSSGIVKEAILRLRHVRGRSAEVVVTFSSVSASARRATSAARSQLKFSLADVSRVVLGRHIPDFHQAAADASFEHYFTPEDVLQFSDPSNVLPSAVLEPTRECISRSSSSLSASRNSFDASSSLLTFLCTSERDLEAIVIALARLRCNSQHLDTLSTCSIFLQQQPLTAHSALVGQGTNHTSARIASSSLRNNSAGGSRNASSQFIVWDVASMSRRFAHLDRQQVVTSRNSHLIEKEILLCKQQNIDVGDYVAVKRFVFSSQDSNAPMENSTHVKMVSLYSIRMHCRVTIYQAHMILKLWRDLGMLREARAFVTGTQTST